jgi:hypothetical protein
VFVSGVLGNLAANGTWQITVTGPTTFRLNGSSGSGAYTSGGTVSGGDLGMVDTIVQANAVPLAVTAKTLSATTTPIVISCDVWVPLAQSQGVSDAVKSSVASYLSQVPIGGLSDPGGAYTNVLPVDAVIDAVFNASSAIQNATVTLNGLSANASVGQTSVPTVSGSINVTIHGV